MHSPDSSARPESVKPLLAHPAARLHPALAWVLALIAASLCCTWVAVWNGYPLLHSDTTSYLIRAYYPLSRKLPPFRPPFYGFLLLYVARVAGLGAVLFVQSMIVVYVVMRALQTVVPSVRPAEFLVVVAILSAVSSLSWYCSNLMPDLFCGCAVLLPFVLAFSAEIFPYELRILWAVQSLVLITHLVYSPIMAAVSAMLVGLDLAGVLKIRRSGSYIRGCVLSLGCVHLLVVGVNWLEYGIASESPVASFFMLARLAEDGVLTDFLNESCPTSANVFCAYRREIRRNASWFLWSGESPLAKEMKARDWMEIVPGTAELVRDGIAAHPRKVIMAALRNSWRQMLLFAPGFGLNSAFISSDIFWSQMRLLTRERDREIFRGSRQAQRRLALELWGDVHKWVIGISSVILVGLMCLSTAFGRARSSACLSVATLVGILVNACLSGALSAPVDRYGSRIIWLVPFAAIAAALNWKQAITLLRQQDGQTPTHLAR